METIQIGKTQMPRMLVGSFNISSQEILDEMVATACEHGATGFDTSPSYGSETMLGKAWKRVGIPREKIFCSDKIDGWQMCRSNGEIEPYLDRSLSCLGTDYLDLLLIHWPFREYLTNTWRCMERIYRSGRVRAIGLCNVDRRHYEAFLAEGVEIEPHAVQIELSPFRTASQDVSYFLERKIAVMAYSPLCRMIPEIRDNAILKEIAETKEKSVSQVILRWHLSRGTSPIFTSSKASRIVENLSVFDFSLTPEEMDRIDSLNRDYKIFPESYACPGY